MSEWQPIETAPKDGSSILCYEPQDGRREGRAVCAWQNWGDGYGKWYVLHDAEDYGWADYSPSYWQSLPEPPK